jgi:predicted esterase
MLMGHGDADPLVLFQWGQLAAKRLEEGGWKVNLKVYPGLEHSSTPEEIDDVENYLNERIPALGDKQSL